MIGFTKAAAREGRTKSPAALSKSKTRRPKEIRTDIEMHLLSTNHTHTNTSVCPPYRKVSRYIVSVGTMCGKTTANSPAPNPSPDNIFLLFLPSTKTVANIHRIRMPHRIYPFLPLPAPLPSPREQRQFRKCQTPARSSGI